MKTAASAPSAVPRNNVLADVARLRKTFFLVPWRMRPKVLGLVVASIAVSFLDVLAVAAMLPLTQMLTSAGAVPESVQNFVVPLVRTEDPQALLYIVASIVVVALLLKNVLTIVLRWWSIGVVQSAGAAMQSEMLRRYLAAPYVTHLNRSRSVILQTITGSVPSGMSAVLRGYVGVLVDAVMALVLLVTLLVLSPVVSLISVVVFGGGSLLLARVLKPWAVRTALRTLDRNTESWNYLNPAIEGFRESRIFGREKSFSERYAENRKHYAGLSRDSAMLAEAPKYTLEIFLILGILLVAFTLFATKPLDEAFGLLGAFGVAALRLVPAMNRIVTNLNVVRSGRPALEQVTAEMASLEDDALADPSQQEQEQDLPVEDIVVSGLGYRYPGSERDVLTDVDVVIPRGRTIALVGSSGAGKTTFADILAGLLTPTSGTVTTGGFDISSHPRSWRRQVAMVSQKVYIWEAPLRDLITFCEDPAEVDEQRLRSAIERARLTSIVDDLPDGLDTRIGDGGSRLSGGQVQRVGIARALYADPQVLILDEATSALDNETEHEITATIEALHGQITVVVIAHRLSTVKNADEILFFARGRLRSRGTMAHLRETDPEFARLVELGSLDSGRLGE